MLVLYLVGGLFIIHYFYKKFILIYTHLHLYHVKCEHCGMVMHTVIHQVGDNMPHEVTSPSPRNNITMMTIDVVGDKAENFDLAGKEMSIWELNQLAEEK